MLPHWPGDSLGVRDDSLGGGYLLVVLFCVIDPYQTKNTSQTQTKRTVHICKSGNKGAKKYIAFWEELKANRDERKIDKI